MRVRVLQDHSSPIGPHRAKHTGDEFTARAEDAEAYIAAGMLSEVKDGSKASAKGK
jgi:hypothetical protein